MSAAKVIIAEIDRSSRVPESKGVYAYMVLPLLKGRTDEAMFISNEDQFLEYCTPNNSIDVGMDLGHYVAIDFLRRSNKLWLSRAHNNATFSGIRIPADGTSGVSIRLTEDFVDPEQFVFGVNDAFLIYAESKGAWGDEIGIKITKNDRETLAFNVEVYWKGYRVEVFPCSRDPLAKDGYGQSLYIVDVLNGSKYVKALDNEYIAEDIKPKYIDATTTSWEKPYDIRGYADAAGTLTRVDEWTMKGGNPQIQATPLTVAGVAGVIKSGSSIPSEVTSDISKFSFGSNADIDNIKVDGLQVQANWTVTAGAFPAGSTDLNQSDPDSVVRLINPTLVTPWATGTAKVWSIEITDNLSGVDGFVVVEGSEIQYSAGDTGAIIASKVIAGLAVILSGNPEIDSIANGGAVLTVTYHEQVGDAKELRITTNSVLQYHSTYVSQSFQPEILGRPQIEVIHVTGEPQSDGDIAVGVETVAVLDADSKVTVASKIAAVVNAGTTYTATAAGETVTITYLANEPQNSLLLDELTTATGLDYLTQQTGITLTPAIPKVARVKLLGGNVYGEDFAVNLDGVHAIISAGSTTALMAASDIAAGAGWLAGREDIESVTSSGDEVSINYTAEGLDAPTPELVTGFTTIPHDLKLYNAQMFTASTGANAEIQGLKFITGNSSCLNELVYINGIPFNVTADDDTPDKVAQRLVDSGVANEIAGVQSIALSAIDPRIVEITYDLTSGDVPLSEVFSGFHAPAYLGAGSDGGVVSDSHMVKALDNQEPLDFNISMDGGWTTVGYQKELAEKAEMRKDHIAILSTPYQAEHSRNYMDAILDYRAKELNLNSTYAALFTGHLKIVDKFNDRKIWIPPTGAVGALASATMTDYEFWYPIAGERRGNLHYPIDVKHHFTDGELDLLQANQINPIWFEVGRGIKLWGQRTLSVRPSALDRINVRLLLIYIELAMGQFLKDSLFELITEEELERMIMGADIFMDGISQRKGVYNYRNEAIATAQDIDNNTIRFKTYLEPVKSLEYIIYNPIIMRTGAIESPASGSNSGLSGLDGLSASSS